MTTMTRTRALLLAAFAAATLVGCGMETGDGSEPETIEPGTSQTQSLDKFDSRDALLAALGSATLDCLGTVNPATYLVNKSGVLIKNFKSCPMDKSGASLKQIDAILGVANSAQGKKDKLNEHYAATWKSYQDNFPENINVCPKWKRTTVIHPPTFANVKNQTAGEPGKESYVYDVAEPEQCKGQPNCVVAHALSCAGGFGSQFLIGGDVQNSSVKVDPVWWLTRYVYADDMSNPFMTQGYYHAMSYYGDAPGSVYGAVQREGEACSEYLDGKHYIDRQLVGIDCGGGWICMSYCMVPPPPPPPPPPPAEEEPEAPAT
jgi:hypothetical protein